MTMAEYLLGDLQTTVVDQHLSERVPEHVRVDPRADLPAEVAQRRLKRRIAQRAPAACQPRRRARIAEPALLRQYRENNGQNSSTTGTRCSSRAPFKRTTTLPVRRSRSASAIPNTPWRPCTRLQSPIRCPVRHNNITSALSRHDPAASISSSANPGSR